MRSKETFKALLSKAVHVIAVSENKNIATVQDEFGHALGRDNGSCIDYWRRGHFPAALPDLTNLAKEIANRNGLSAQELQQLLLAADPLFPTNQLKTILAPARHHNGAASDRRPESPFVVGPPITNPKQFYGRTQEIRRLTNWWRTVPLQNVAIVGLKRSGKTSLLHFLKNRNDLNHNNSDDAWQQIQWIFIDFQDPRLVRQERVLQHILAELGFSVPQPCTLETFMDIVAYKITRPTIMLIDELIAGLESPDLNEPFWWSMRSLVSHYAGGNLAFVLTAHSSPMELAESQGKPSPFFNMFNTINLGPFLEEEARVLIASSPQRFTDAEVDWIVAQSRCWPALVQILCQVRLDGLLGHLPRGRHWQTEGLAQMSRFNYLLEP